MEQTNNVALSMLQAVAAQTQVPKTGKSDGDSDFQKMMDKAVSGSKDSRVEDQPQTDKPAAAAPKKEAPAQKKTEEDPIEMSKKAQMIVVGQLDPETLPDPVTVENPVTGEELTIIQGDWAPQVWAYESTPEEIAGEPSTVVEGMQPVDVSDPEADQMLEATAPGADNSPAAMLERATAEQFGEEVQKVAEEVRPQVRQEETGDTEVEVTDVEQAPQRIFHDVKAAPVKVGEVYDAQQADEPTVAKQIDTGLAQALETGESMVRIQLTPENLGSVTVEISQSAEGIIRVALSAHSGETRNLLERHAGELQSMLASRTQQNVEVDVQRQQESQQSQQQQNYDGHNGHAQNGQERRQQRRDHAGSQDFIQQLRLGLIPADGEEI